MATRLDNVYAALLARRAAQGRLRRLTLPAPGAVDFSSNGYLSLAASGAVRAAYLARLQAATALPLGSGGSRLLDGNSAAAEALERAVAGFHGAAAGLLFGSGFDANTGLLGCAPRPGDVVVHDELVHASVHDGMRLGRARRVAFAHNRVRGPGGLDAVLAGLAAAPGVGTVFVTVESVYSMDGDVAPLRDMVDCVERQLPRGNGCVVVDEAHATGWLGPGGRGLVSQLGLEERVWARVHTFGKALGCSGAIVLCSPTTRAYLVNYARSFIYTTAMGYPALAAIETAYDHLGSGRAEPLRRRLAGLMRLSHRLLASLCARRRPPPDVLRIRDGPPASPIVPLFTAQARSLAQHCQQRGFVVRAIVAPTVLAGTDRVRLCLHAGNTAREVQGLCEAIEEWVCARLGETVTATEAGDRGPVAAAETGVQGAGVHGPGVQGFQGPVAAPEPGRSKL